MAGQTPPTGVGLDLRQAVVGLDPAASAAGLDLTPAASFAPPPPEPPGPFVRGLKTGVSDLKSIGGGVLQYAGRGLGAKPLETLGETIGNNAAAESAPYRMQVEDVGKAFDQGVGPGLGAAADLVKYTVGNQIPMLATTIAGGVGGRLAAGALGATRAAAGVSAAEKAAAVAKVAAGTATPGEAAIASAVKAADLGAELGLGASSVGMELGQIAPEGLKPENNASMLQMAAGALVSGATDTVLPIYLARKMGLIGAAERALTPRAAGLGAIAKDVGGTALKAGAFEAGQETTQSAIERAASNQPLTGPEAGSDYLNSGVMGGIMGILTGGIAGGVHSMQRPVKGAEQVVASPTEPAVTPTEPAPAPPTPEAVHADLVAQHAAATENLAALGQAVTQAQQQHDALVAARKELDNESKLEIGQRRTKSEITTAKRDVTKQIKAAKAKIEELGGQVFAARNTVEALAPQIEASRQTLQGDTNGLQIEGQAPAQEVTPLTFPTIDYPTAPTPYQRVGTVPDLVQPEIAPRAAPVVSDTIADPNLPPPTPAEQIDRAVKGVHALFREQGMPLTTTEESLATPPQTPREVALAKVEQRAPREAVPQASPEQMKAVEENAMSVIEPLAQTLAQTKTKTPEGQAKVAAKMVKAMRGVVQEAAKQGSIEAAQQHVTENLPKALKGLGVTTDAADMAKAVNAGVGLAKTQFSKGATEIDRSPKGLRAWAEKKAATDPTYDMQVVVPADEGISADTYDDGHPFKVIDGGGNEYGTFGTRKAADAFITEELDGRTYMQSESNAALTQDEFDTLPPEAQAAAADAYTSTMRAKGTALIGRLLSLIGDRPELRATTFSAEPGGHIGSYTRTGPLKAAISMALNAKEGLSVADHEGYHFAEDWLLTAGEKKVVANALREDKPLFDQLVAKLRQYDRENGTNLTDEVTGIPAEARAYAFEFWRRGEFKAEGALATAWAKIKQFFERVANAVRGQGFQSIEDVFAALSHGQMAEREMVAPEGRAAYESRARGNSWYYSALTDAVAAMPTKQASAQGWRDQIKGLVAKGVVKQVEIDAVGLNDWLDLQSEMAVYEPGFAVIEEWKDGNGPWQQVDDLGMYSRTKAEAEQKVAGLGAAESDDGSQARYTIKALPAINLGKRGGKVTKDEVMAFLGEHGVQVREVVLGGKKLIFNDLSPMSKAAIKGVMQRNDDLGFDSSMQAVYAYAEAPDNYDLSEADRAILDDLITPDIEKTKFSDYQLPGGENYRELLLTLPRAKPETIRQGRDGGWMVQAHDGAEVFYGDTREQAMDRYERGRTSGTGQDFTSSHFDQPNILAHVRFNERTDAEGKRVLFIEELQSDWAQKGRKEGFRKEEFTVTNLNGIRKAIFATEREANQFITESGRDDLEIRQEPSMNRGIPSAPFVTKTEAWTALALKRMIRYAAENGFDKVAWTTGSQQAERYKLSNTVSKIEVSGRKDMITGEVSKSVELEIRDGSYVQLGVNSRGIIDNVNGELPGGKVIGKPLDEVIGKDMAEKIMASHGKVKFEGIELDVGGKGMAGYYDKIVPSVANEILRKLGGGKVGVVALRGALIERINRDKVRVSLDDGTYRFFSSEQNAQEYIDKFGTPGGLEQPGFTITPALAEHAANGLPLFSKAAVEMRNRMAGGELEAMQIGEQYAHIIENAKPSSDILTRALGIAREDVLGGIGRWWTNNMSTPNYISSASNGFKNVYQAFNTYSRYRKILAEQLVRERVPDWYKASDADRRAAFDVMLKRTLEKYTASSQELTDLLTTLTPAQRKLYDQATGMIAGVLRRQFDSQKESRRRHLGAAAYEKWLADRQEQVTALIDQGYVPLRRYGDYSVEVYMESPDGKRVKAGLEFFNSPSQAKTAALAYAKEIERQGVALKVEMGRRSKNERDTGVSLEQFLGTLRRQGIDISQAERERLVVAMTNADSLVRTQMMRREGLAGFSTDSMRVLHEFGVNTSSEIAYARFAPVLDAALDGAEVTSDIDARTSEPVITIGESFGRREDGVANNLWERDGPMSGFYKDRANAMADTTLVPDRQSVAATKLRTASVMYFIGGSISGAAVNTLSVPMVLTPYLSTHTDYLNATMTSMKTWKDAWQHYSVLRDMDKMKNPDPATAARLDAAGIDKGMRDAIVAAADHIFDTEIHMMLGISQGSLYSKSRNIQRAAEVWMAPFRVTEQTNRLASFMAAYRVATTGDGVKQADGSFKKLSGQELFRFASETVDQTQNNYNTNNRPGIMSNPIGALMFQFKSFPLFIIEATALMYKANPKSAVYMLLGLTAMAGVQGLPFAEEILNLIDVISQQLFNSPFNSRRAMRNAIKSASDAIGAADLSDALMRGLVNEITGVGVATRVSSGFLPGTRLGTADTSSERVLSDIAGAPWSMVKDTMSNVAPFVSGVAHGDWRQAADAIRAGSPIAVRNVVKGAEQLSTGYASDSRGRKTVDVSTIDGLLQLTGLSSAAVTKASDMESIIIQTKAFYTQVSKDLETRLVKAYRDGDTEQINRIISLKTKWNEQNPTMPILANPAATRRDIMLAGVPLNRREQILLGRRLGGEFSDVTAHMAQ